MYPLSEDLDELGITGKAPPTRIINPYGHFETSELVLKIYTLIEKGETISRKQVRHAMNFVRFQIEEGKLNTRSGMGFGIVSPEILNISRWDKEYSDVIVPGIYTLEDELWQREQVDEVGAYCSGERVIYNFENEE